MEAIHSACILGGTHGNELSGINLLKKWGENPDIIERPSFKTKTLVANPEAVALNRRYKDCDMNRQFAPETLAREDTPSTPYEVRRAKAIKAMLEEGGDVGPCDVILDLHNTTSNMKVTLIYRDSPASVMKLQMIHYIMDRMPETCYALAIYDTNPADTLVLAPIALGIEVGPQAHGVLRGDIFLLQEQAIMHALDFIEMYNTGTEFPATTIPVYKFLKNVVYPRDSQGNLSAMIHPKFQDQDWKPLTPDSPVFLQLDGKTVCLKDVVPECTSFSEPIYPTFINEGAYYEKDIAFQLTTKHVRDVAKLKRNC